MEDGLLGMKIRDARLAFEGWYIETLVQKYGNIAAAARHAGMERTAFHRKMEKLGIATLTDRKKSPKQKAVRVEPEKPDVVLHQARPAHTRGVGKRKGRDVRSASKRQSNRVARQH